MYCIKCGAKILENSAFCSSCGAEQDTTRANSTYNAQNNTNYQNQGDPIINNQSTYQNNTISHSKVTALLLCIFLGALGAHRFYVGKFGTGILYLFTFGLFGIGSIFDLIMIVTDNFYDSNGAPLI